jgi:hypothetical protein
MNIHFLSRPVRRFLMDHLERLHESLELLGQRLRGSIAQLVGTQVGDAVRDAVEGLLSCRPMPVPERWRPEERRWHDPRPHDDGYGKDGYWQDDEPEPQQEFATAPPESPSCWKTLLAGAVQVALWWLRRGPQGLSLWQALGVGGTAGAAALMGGPVTGAVLVVLATTVLLTRLADEAIDATGPLAGLASR